ncbi:MAG: DUF6531 domain-containing protein [Polyangiaceae bacterium]
MRTAPAPNIPAPPGMNPGAFVAGGGGDGGGKGGKGGKNGSGNENADGSDGDDDASGDGNDGGEGCGDPICPITGRMFLDVLDFGISGPLPLRWIRSYSSRLSNLDGELGHGWSHPFAWRIRAKRRKVTVIDDRMREQRFPLPAGAPVGNGSGMELARHNVGFQLTQRDGTRLDFQRVTDDGWFHLTSVRDSNGNSIELARSARGILESIRDSAGRFYRVSTDDHGRILRIAVRIEPGGTFQDLVQYGYDAAGDLVTTRDPEGHVWSCHYERHLLTAHGVPTGLVYHYAYDGTTKDARCVESWGSYRDAPDPALDPALQQAQTARGVKGINHVRLTFVPEDHYAEVEDSLGGLTRYFGDASGRVLTKIDPAGGVTENRYSPETGALVSRVLPDGTEREVARSGARSSGFRTNAGTQVATYHDGTGYEVRWSVPDDALTVREFDRKGNLVFVHHPDDTTEEYGYDSRGLVIWQIDQAGALSKFEYDALGNLARVTHANGQVATSEHDYLGRRTAYTDELGRRTEWSYDRRGYVVQKRFPDGTQIDITRDALGNPTLVVDRGRVHRFAWGGVGWLVEWVAPGPIVNRYLYDTEGNRTSTINGRGETFRREYDFTGKCVSQDTYEGVHFDAQYDVAGRPVQIRSELGIETREYGPEGRLVGAERPDEAVELEYDRALRRYSYANGKISTSEVRDAMGRVISENTDELEQGVLWLGGLQAAFWTDIDRPIKTWHRPDGRIRRLEYRDAEVGFEVDPQGTFFLSLGRELVLRVERDFAERVRRQVLTRRSSLPSHALGTAEDPNVIWWGRYEYALEHITREDYSDGSSVVYEHNAAGQVTRAARTAPDGSKSDERIGYDGAASPRLDGVVFDAVSRPVQVRGERLEYDEIGRPIARYSDRGTWEYEWSYSGELIAVRAPDREVRMEYDVRGRRVRKVVVKDGVEVTRHRYVWANHIVQQRIDELTWSVRTYLRSPGDWEVFGHVDESATGVESIYYVIHPSAMPLFAVDSGGRTRWQATASVFGEVTLGKRDVQVDVRYANQEWDDDVELIYNLRRWYDPRTGLYISPDPLFLEGSPNLRDYALNPLTYMDPMGLYPPPVPANGQPRPSSPPTASSFSTTGTYLLGPGYNATTGGVNSQGQFVPGYAACPPGWDPTAQSGWPDEIQSTVDNAGYTFGCHSCGSKDPGGTGHFTPDHVPTVSAQQAAANSGNPIPFSQVRYYPHCQRCSNAQKHQSSHAAHNPTANAARGRAQAAQQTDGHFMNPSAEERRATAAHIFGTDGDGNPNYPTGTSGGRSRRRPLSDPLSPENLGLHE